MEIPVFDWALLFLAPFLFRGVMEKTKAFWAGRKGPRVMQFLFDLVRLLRKGEVISPTTTYLFQLAPSVVLAAVVFAGLLLPGVGARPPISFEGDFLLFLAVLALGSFFALVNAWDIGSSFEGMGASREAVFRSIPEPAFFIVLGSLCLYQGAFSFEKLTGVLRGGSELSLLVTGLIVVILFILLLLEGKRIPMDDPATHLELTMIHEVMILDNSGPSLAFFQYASAMKMVIFSKLIALFLIPAGTPAAVAGLLITAVLFLIAVTIGTIESSMARLRLVRVPDFLLPTIGLSLIVMFVILLLVMGGLR